ncbi:MAG: hypothetical protein J1G38_01515 [Clostridiales bacterium]|nr:hypothetical protein [Clostridiales bacterium]
MRKKILIFTATVLAAVMTAGLFVGCGEDKAPPRKPNSGWEDLDGWEDDDFDYPGPGTGDDEPDLPVFTYNGSDWAWIGAEESYYEGDEVVFENYQEEGSDPRPILTKLNGATVSFIVAADYETDAKFVVRTAVDLGWQGACWASDKFEMTVNGQDINLNGTDDGKWLWQQADWWTNANYIDVNFGNIHLLSGNNEISIYVKSDNVQLDCFIIQPW